MLDYPAKRPAKELAPINFGEWQERRMGRVDTADRLGCLLWLGCSIRCYAIEKKTATLK